MRGSRQGKTGQGTVGCGALVLLLLLLAASPGEASPAPPPIDGYRPLIRPFIDPGGALQVAVRQFERGGEPFFLVLDPVRFALREVAGDRVPAAPAADRAWTQTPFFKALSRLTAPPFPLVNDGLTAAERPVAGYFLTIDLCPASRPLDRSLFTATAALPQRGPVPVTVMVSGRWLTAHRGDVAWLREQEAAGRLAITWGNHSLTHAHDPAAPPERDFLLTPGTDMAAEALRLERLLLTAGLPPSPFFRFPGLVSDRRAIEALRELCLLPIGSNGWLAKGQPAQPGGILLVHGNGNEPEGVRRLLRLYQGQREAWGRGDVSLLPLREAFAAP